MSTAEFVHRVIADPAFKPFTVADPPRRPFYLPHWAPAPMNADDWDALADPNRKGGATPSNGCHPGTTVSG
ncbi:hypothetical protein ACQEUX_16000 [Micromonospora sp. CA-259024]|uniref:hypothetical protein n=1 Tax=Micromonospora sp. CA-259024 TaxID=3239965 RepID=UPI003D8CF536